jgi:hypothetical protein
MANPNIVGVSQIFGKTNVADLTSTSAISVVSNAASSNKILKINSIIISNVDGNSPFDVTINLYSAAALGGTATAIASTISVPADASLVVLDKSTSLYLEEDKSIGAIASSANKLKVVCSYEEIA